MSRELTHEEYERVREHFDADVGFDKDGVLVFGQHLLRVMLDENKAKTLRVIKGLGRGEVAAFLARSTNT